MSQVTLTHDEQWLVFATRTEGVSGSPYRMRLDGSQPERLTPKDQQLFGYNIQKIEDGWIYFTSWNGYDPHNPKNFVPYRIPFNGGRAEIVTQP